MKYREALEIAKKYPNSFEVSNVRKDGDPWGIPVRRIMTKEEIADKSWYRKD